MEIVFDIYRLKVRLLPGGNWVITSSQYIEVDGRLVTMAPGDLQQLCKFHFSQIDELIKNSVVER